MAHRAVNPNKAAPGRQFAAMDSILFAGLLALLMFGPLAFGGVEPWAIALLEGASALLFALWTFRQWRQGGLKLPAAPMAIPFLVFLALIAIQLMFSLTAYRYATYAALALAVAYFFIFVVSAHSFRTERHLAQVALALGAYGFLVAVFGVIQSVTYNGKIYWMRTLDAGSVPFGPYVNHNHYAGLMEMLAPIPLAVLFTAEFPRPQRVIAGFAAVVMGGSIFVSLSRGGMLAFLVEVIFLWVALHGVRSGRRSLLTLGAMVAITASFLVWFNGSQFVDRITDTPAEWNNERAHGRWATTKDAWRMFLAKPLTGFGLDSFPVVYPRYRSYYTNDFVNQAHNDHVQLLVETGIAGYGIMFWFVLQLYRRGIRKLRDTPPIATRVMTAAAMAGCTGLLIHSFSDFNFHIPANAAMFWAFSALAGAAPEVGNPEAFTRVKPASRSQRPQ